MKTPLFAWVATLVVAGAAAFGQAAPRDTRGNVPADQLVLYPPTEGLPRSDEFTIKVRTPGQDWHDLAAYCVKVAQVVDTKATTQDTSIASFDFQGKVDVAIKWNKGTINTAKVRPLSFNINFQVADNTITFSLDKPRNLSVEVNADIFHNLQLFANPLETDKPDPGDPNVIFFGPGVHQVGTTRVPGGKTVNAGESNLIRNVRFENIRVEDFREGQLVNLRVMYNTKYNTSPGRGIEHVLFKDVTYAGTHANLSVIAGYDDSRAIKDVVFENLKINGRVIADNMLGKPAWYKTGDLARFFVGEHVEGLVFHPAQAGATQP